KEPWIYNKRCVVVDLTTSIAVEIWVWTGGWQILVYGRNKKVMSEVYPLVANLMERDHELLREENGRKITLKRWDLSEKIETIGEDSVQILNLLVSQLKEI
ncbi:MAG: hypothetical protein AAF226_00330, partial [Verrucomicrobiota bacterium]